MSDVGANRTAFGDGGVDGAMLEVALSGLTSTTTGRAEGRRDDMVLEVVVVVVMGEVLLTKSIDDGVDESGEGE